MDHLESVRKLRAQVIEKAKALNLEVGGFSLIPADEEEGRDVVNVTFLLTPEAVESFEETEKRKTDDEFEKMFAANFGDMDIFASEETQEQTAAEVEEAARRKKELDDMLKDFED